MLALGGREVALSNRWAGKAALRRWYANKDLKEVRRQVREQRTRPKELPSAKIPRWWRVGGRHGGCLRNSKEVGTE